MDTPENEVLFVSDVSAELDAAQAAGMKTALCVRSVSATPAVVVSSTAVEPGDALSHPIITTFDVVLP
jgi:methionine salvage enolase-phosphatase E1